MLKLPDGKLDIRPYVLKAAKKAAHTDPLIYIVLKLPVGTLVSAPEALKLQKKASPTFVALGPK